MCGQISWEALSEICGGDEPEKGLFFKIWEYGESLFGIGIKSSYLGKAFPFILETTK